MSIKDSSFEHLAASPVEGASALSADQFSSDNAITWRNMARMTGGDNSAQFTGDIYPSTAPSFVDSGNWAQVQPIFDQGTGVNFSSAAENAKSGVQPDFFLGEDGKLVPNPDKQGGPTDGKINIQVEGNKSKVEAAKVANENQKKSIRSMIDYFRKFNPNAEVPQHWLDQLDRQPDVPAPAARNDDPPQRQPDTTPQPRQQQEAPTQRGGGGSGGGGSDGGGGGGGGGRSSGGGGSRGGGERSFNPTEVPRGDRPRNPPPVAGDMNVAGPPTITPEKIDEVLKGYHSPAAGLGQYIYDAGVKAGINPAVALAFFIQESSAGTAGKATQTNSWGNIKGEGPAGSVGGFRAYHDFKEGVDDWYRLINDKYLAGPEKGGFGAETLSQIISHYAPSNDGNNERAYVANVKGMVKGWENA